MKHQNAVTLWNHAVENCYEQSSSLTTFGAAAVAKDVPIYARGISDYDMKNPVDSKGEERIEFTINRQIAAFLREWADALERKND